MNGSEHFQPGDGSQERFPSPTQWTSLIQPAADPSSPKAQEALDRLCQTYWFPLYAFIRSEGIEMHHAKDLIQSFFLHLLEGNLLRQANRGRGRFRTFLLSCLRNFIKDQWRKDSAVKRGGSVTLLSIDEAEAEEKYRKLPKVEPAPECAFDRTWAAAVIEEAMRNLKQAYAGRGRGALFEAMQGCLSGEMSRDAYHVPAAKLGMTIETFEVNLSRFKRDFGRKVRCVIAETVDPSEIDAEIKYLMSAWSAYLNEKS